MSVDLADAPRFLSLEEIRDELAHYSYRPGWRLGVFADPWEGPVFRLVAEVPDAFHPDQTVQLRINSRMPPMRSGHDLAIWLSWRLQQVEIHESREWLRRDGEQPFDPHDPPEPMGDSTCA